MPASDLIIPNWPAPNNIKAISTTRHGGYSSPPFGKLNLGSHVGDDQLIVSQNRQQLIQLANLPESPLWLQQVHGSHMINSADWQADIEADAMFSQHANHICTVMTADCLPLLLCNQQGDTVAAVHVGWRGLAAGIIDKALKAFSCEASDIMAWLGPAIGPAQFEVGKEVYDMFVGKSPNAADAFIATKSQHYLADIYSLARQYLQKQGVQNIFGGEFCTVSDEERFFSYRRDGITGRMASMIWITNK
ncbi:multi-copper polyphenol oxidoreductase [Methylophaga sp. 42_25_T18]|nr:multi-copper polyphenol oxidoreductase [Methylophaga sp. 42_25_T18]OUR88913.1 multi-copper polyphenol oxidoreductase [Methylophaga sp. 42_8_T64]